MRVSLFDGIDEHKSLFPVTLTRPIGEIRCGLLTIKEKWKYYFPSIDGYITQSYLTTKYPEPQEGADLLINGSLLPHEALLPAINQLQKGQCLFVQSKLAAYKPIDPFDFKKKPSKVIHLALDFSPFLVHPYQIISRLGQEIQADYFRLVNGRTSETITDPNTKVYGNQLFIEKGARIRAATLNTETGPIYLGEHSEVQEGVLIRGPFGLGAHSTVNMGAKIKGDTSIGPHSKVGGEISVSVIQGYSNKGHDGFLGHSYIGEWCNLGADTNNSNLKNTYASVKFWDYISNNYQETGMQFLGLIMGDHSKTGINTMVNTGTSIGVAANIFGAGYPPTYLPSFIWGGIEKQEIYNISKAIDTAKRVYERRSVEFTHADEQILRTIFDFAHNQKQLI